MRLDEILQKILIVKKINSFQFFFVWFNKLKNTHLIIFFVLKDDFLVFSNTIKKNDEK
jgi:hypothetical protein